MSVKIRFQFHIIVWYALIFSTTNLTAQPAPLNKYGLAVIKDLKTLHFTTILDSNKKIQDIKKIIPGILLDLRYATTDNFMKRKLYPDITTTYLRILAAKALQQVQQELNGMGLGLKIYDAYRPYSVTKKMWEPIKDTRYVADPKKGSGHNRGIAVDITLINLKNGEELPMGTGYDNFSDTAHQTFTGLSKEILHNRNILKRLMEKHGFISLESEWWHYSLPNTRDFEILDISFKKLRKAGLQR